MTATEAIAGESIELSRLLSAAPGEVFAAWTEPERLCAWMGIGIDGGVEVELDLRPGGRFRIDVGGDYVITGAYREIAPPERLVFTWASPTTKGAETLVTLQLRARGDGTELHLRHEQLPDAEVASRHGAGWRNTCEKLESYLREQG